MKKTLKIALALLVVAAAASFIACDINSGPGEGSLLISFEGGARSIWEVRGDLDIKSYKITIDGPEGTFEEVHNVPNGVPEDGRQFVIDSLRAGEYTITIEGFNDEGDKIAELIKNSESNREIKTTILRSQVNKVTAVLVPYVDGQTGTLEITEILFTDAAGTGDFNKKLMKNNPRIIMTIKHLAGKNLNEKDNGSDKYVLIKNDESEIKTADVTRTVVNTNDVRFTKDLSTSGDTGPHDISAKAMTLTDMPAGWYQITVELQTDIDGFTDGDAKRTFKNWGTVIFAQVMNFDESEADPTKGTITVRDSMLETGSIDFAVFENMARMPVEITTDKNPDFEFKKLDSETVEFTADATVFSIADWEDDDFYLGTPSDDALYVWFVNGAEVQSKTKYAGGASFTGTSSHFAESGIYSVAVYVLDHGAGGAKDNAFGAASEIVTVTEE